MITELRLQTGKGQFIGYAPYDTYPVKIQNLRLVNIGGKPVVDCGMEVLTGAYKGKRICMNQEITNGFQVHSVNRILRGLCTPLDYPPKVNFTTYTNYGLLLWTIKYLVKNRFYNVQFSKDEGFEVLTDEANETKQGQVISVDFRNATY